jgi:hypothetical protein
MTEYNARIRESLADGSFAANVKTGVPAERNPIDFIGLWGAEPTLNLKAGAGFVRELLDYYKPRTLFMSTNAIAGIDAVSILADAAIEYNRTRGDPSRFVKLIIQFSLDGPAWINDVSRAKGAAANTLKVAREYAAKYSNNPFMRGRINNKATLTFANIRAILDSPEGVRGYCQFFIDAERDVKQSARGNAIEILLTNGPTLVTPGGYSVDDGRTYAEYLRGLRALLLEGMGDSMDLTPTSIGLIRDFVNIGRLQFSRGMGTCSAGNRAIAVDSQGNLYSCHRVYSNNMFESNKELARMQGAKSGSERDAVRLEYVCSAHHEFEESRRHFWDTMLISTASCGQCDKKYLYDKAWRDLLYLTSGCMNCHVGSCDDVTGDIMIPSNEYIKLMGNGALEELIAMESDRRRLQKTGRKEAQARHADS